MSFSNKRRTFLKSSLTVAAANLSPVRAALSAFGGVAPAVVHAAPQAKAGWPLMRPELSHSLGVRCLTKPVLAEQLIDDMERDGGCSATQTVWRRGRDSITAVTCKCR
jgi:hypothetical protein